ncbi:hypothetical protein ACIQXW_23680 [Lysinibacillus sp. NPDC097162]|uniref:hypothetical protein n=1 Tax=Lysinibacillus sp. NPDC097162 TaxID=3364140 RepID=UPI00381F40AC
MTTKTTYKVGDKVKFLDVGRIYLGYKHWSDRDISEIIEIDSVGDLIVKSKKQIGRSQYVCGSEFKYIEKVAVQVSKFKVGDKVVVTNDNFEHKKGDIRIIDRIGSASGTFDYGFEGGGYIKECNIEIISQKPTKNQRITALEQTVANLQAEVEALKATQKIAVKAPTMTVKADVDVAKIAESLAKAIEKHMPKSPNEQRKAIIDDANAFVEDVFAEVDQQMGWRTTKIPLYKEKGRLHVNFHVNEKKRTVTAVAYFGNLYPGDKEVVGKAIAKCAPDDVFNADIGKAIALGRALGLDVSKFEKAVQPSEVVVGMHVRTRYMSGGYNDNCPTFVTGVRDGYPAFDNGTYSPHYDITNDTEAQY